MRMAPGAGARTSGTWTQRDELAQVVASARVAGRWRHGAGGYGLWHLRRGGPARRHAPRRGSLFALLSVPCVGAESHRTAPLRALRQTGWQRAGIRVFGGNEALGHCVERCYARPLPRRSSQVVPGTAMYVDVRDAKERADLIAYLEEADRSEVCKVAQPG